jgi:short-subunit dehydrogenase
LHCIIIKIKKTITGRIRLKNPKSILITGASSGIGAALANEYAEPGIVLHLSGRNKGRLEAIKTDCETRGATAHIYTIDVTDEVSMSDWVLSCHPLDLVIANAGVSSSLSNLDNISDHTKNIFDINVLGVFNTIHPAIKCMKPSGQGQIAVVASVAGFRGLPSAPAYSTSKVTVKAYGEALRGLYYKDGLEINVISPGFVKSRITDKNKFKMPFLIEADQAAKIICRGLKINKPHIIFPWQMHVITFIAQRLVPNFVLDYLLKKLPQK